MLSFFYFLCHLKKTDVIEIKTGNQIQSAIATATLDMITISKKENKTYTAPCLRKQDLPNGYL